MEGPRSRSGYGAGQTRLARDKVAGTSRVIVGDQVYLDGAHNPHAMLRLDRVCQ